LSLGSTVMQATSILYTSLYLFAHLFACLLTKIFYSTYLCIVLFFFQRRRVLLTPEQASEFYAEHFGKQFFPSLVAYMSSGPVVALVLAREKAIDVWRELIGPTSTVKAQTTHPDRQAYLWRLIHYTGQSVSASNPSSKLEDLFGV